jgi:uncharacterized membrane protein YdjX (TVP38/TMEM64 family)
MGSEGGGWAEKLPVIGAVLLTTVFLAAFVLIDEVQEAALALLDWFDQLGVWGVVLYVAFYIGIVLSLLPGVVFTLGAGFVFGFWLGAGVVVFSLAAGSTLAFLVARYALGERLSRKIKGHPRIQLLNKGLQHEGWKIVMLSRFLPVFPFKLSNYFFGLTAIPLRHFVVANAIGVLPISVTNVYLGSLAAELADLTEREPGWWEWALYGGGLVAAIGLVYYITRLARRSMRQTLEEKDEG